jgi:hypothetical protein
MVFIDIKQDGYLITLSCHKGSEDGEFFQLVIDARTREVIKRPEKSDIDASAAYSCVWSMLENGEELPAHAVAEWG